MTDLPAGWAVDNSADNSTPPPPCLKSLKPVTKASDEAESQFVKGTDLPTFDESLAYYGTRAIAAARFAAGVAIINTCKEISFTSDGQTITGSIGPLSFPRMGQQSAAWQLVLSVQGVTAGIDIVVVQQGSEIAVTEYANIGTPVLTEVTSLVAKAVAKVPAN